MLSHSNLGRRQAVPQVALSELPHQVYGACREVAGTGLSRASVEGVRPPSGASLGHWQAAVAPCVCAGLSVH
eukprot:7225609-Alexandrium_andersonii.AAC.1